MSQLIVQQLKAELTAYRSRLNQLEPNAGWLREYNLIYNVAEKALSLLEKKYVSTKKPEAAMEEAAQVGAQLRMAALPQDEWNMPPVENLRPGEVVFPGMADINRVEEIRQMQVRVDQILRGNHNPEPPVPAAPRRRGLYDR